MRACLRRSEIIGSAGVFAAERGYLQIRRLRLSTGVFLHSSMWTSSKLPHGPFRVRRCSRPAEISGVHLCLRRASIQNRTAPTSPSLRHGGAFVSAVFCPWLTSRIQIFWHPARRSEMNRPPLSFGGGGGGVRPHGRSTRRSPGSGLIFLFVAFLQRSSNVHFAAVFIYISNLSKYPGKTCRATISFSALAMIPNGVSSFILKVVQKCFRIFSALMGSLSEPQVKAWPDIALALSHTSARSPVHSFHLLSVQIRIRH